MADPELPTASDTPAASAPPDASAIQARLPDGVPPATTAVTAEAPAAESPTEARVPHKPSPERLARRVRVLDALIIGLVLMLAFFLGSFAVQNSDFWMHLATGRLISEGAYTFGADPFSYTTEGVTWVNHSWLFDWLLYGIYQLAGGVGVVVFRGLLFAALAETLLRVRRPSQSLWLPAVGATLAVLTLSARVSLQPVVVSLLFLGLTLYLLHRATDEGAAFTLRGRRFSPLWLLPPLFALWVNLDGLFLLGPLAVLLFLIGAGVQRLTAGAAGGVEAQAPASAGDVRTLGVVLVVGLAACLLNPYTYRAFVLPVDLAYPLAGLLPEGLVPTGVAAERAATQLPQVYLTYSPFAEVYWSNSSFGLNAAGMAYFPLLLLGIVSFGLLVLVRPPAAAARRFPVGLFLLWLALALLSAGNVRFIPLCAVVGGPAIALNFQELTRRRAAAELSWGEYNWALLGRAATALACLVLLLLAWPGWLHGSPDDPRRSHRVRWETYADPSFERAARQLDGLLRTGKLRHGFNLTPDIAHYFAWHAGREARTFFDPRFALPAQAAEDYALARRSLRDAAAVWSGRRQPVPGERLLSDQERVFRAYRINYLVLTDANGASEAQEITNRLTVEPARWAPLYSDGRTSIFGWRAPGRPDNPFAGLELRPERRAFGQVPEAQRAPASPPVPPDGPPSLWERYAFGQPPAPLESAASLGYLNAYLMLAPRLPRWQQPFLVANLLARCGECAMMQLTGPRDMQIKVLAASLENRPGPPSLPVLAVRAARRAVAENPGDAHSFVVLARAYQTVWRDRELFWQRQLDPRTDPRAVLQPLALLTRDSLRHVQYVASLTQAVRLQPDNAYLHYLLAQHFDESNFPDAALEHAVLAKEHVERFRQRAGEKEGAALTQAVEDQARRLSEEVDRRRDEYARLSLADRTLAEKLKTALYKETRVPRKGGVLKVPRGLVKQARKLMAETDPSTLSREERHLIASLQIHIMLLLGDTRELRETVFDADGKQRLRPVLGPVYEAYEGLWAGAVGDYAEAEKALAACTSPLEAERDLKVFAELEKRMKDAKDTYLLAPLFAVPPSAASFLRLMHELRGSVMRQQSTSREYLQLAGRVAQAAEILTVRGLLALEQGDNGRALAHLSASLNMTRQRTHFPSLPTAQQYELLLKTYSGPAGR